jgi:hypothetical protein
MDYLQKDDEMRNLDTLAQLQLDDHDARVRRHLANRTTLRSLERVAAPVPSVTAQPEGCESTGAPRTATAQRPA